MSLDRKAALADPALLSALGAHIRTRVPASEADDVLQSVIADALAAETAPDEEGALRRWVFGVARNKIVDFYRRTRREQPADAVDEPAAPSSGRGAAADLMRWAEGELPPGSDAKRTFEWMLREGEGEKLESIAASEKLPAPRVRKRVSRMREHFRARWAAYLAALAAAGLAAILVWYMFRRKPVPEARIVPEAPSVPNSAAVRPPPTPTAIPTPTPTPTPSLTPTPSFTPTVTPTPTPTPTAPPRRTRSTTPSTSSLGSGGSSL